MTANDEVHADMRISRALAEENGYWTTPETRARAIASRAAYAYLRSCLPRPGELAITRDGAQL